MKNARMGFVGWMFVGLLAAPAAAQTPATAGLESARDTVEKVLVDLEQIEKDSQSYPDSAAGMRIRKTTERIRGRLNALVPAPAAPAPTSAGPKGAAAPAVFAGGRQSAAGPGKAMPEKEFRDVTRALKTQNLDGQRLGVVQNIIDAGGYFSSAQIAQIIHWFTSDDTKVEAAGRLWGRCTDPDAFDTVVGRLDSAEGKKKLRERIGQGSGETASDGQAAPPGAPKPGGPPKQKAPGGTVIK